MAFYDSSHKNTWNIFQCGQVAGGEGCTRSLKGCFSLKKEFNFGVHYEYGLLFPKKVQRN